MLKVRTDAARNRADILTAADEIFSVHGVTAPLDLVCKEAGVGRATFYRNFPDRHALLVALLEHTIDKMEEASRSLGDSPDAFFELLCQQAERISTHSSLADYWRVVDQGAPEIVKARTRFHAVLRPHLERAVEAGLCRPDLSREDISLLVSMLGAALQGRTANEQARLGRRAFELVVQGLQPRPTQP